MSLSLATKGYATASPVSIATRGVIYYFTSILRTLGTILNPRILSETVRREIIHIPYEAKPLPEGWEG